MRILSFIAVLLLAISCGKEKKSIVTQKEIPFTKEGSLQILKSNDSLVASLDIEIADNDYERETGLMHRTSMSSDRGMLFVFPDEVRRSFYMKNTEIPLDIIFIGKDLRIVSFSENAKPLDESSLYSQVPAQYVLEVNAGLAEQWLLDIGDKVVFDRN